ncbi:hypothetical protein NKI04_26290 [Mesorhizobium sp. M0814]|uniref:hypothetical protein n=1 Tax=Mesorhizobium sp. M0814 TaxID=2957004 RepID=UPI00333873B9
MNKNSNRATSFIAVAHYEGPDKFQGEVRESSAFSPSDTLKDVFAAFWPAPDDHIGAALAGHRGRLPLRIEIMPDAKTIPVDEPHPGGV